MQTTEALAEYGHAAERFSHTIPTLLLNAEAAERCLTLNEPDSLIVTIASLGQALASDDGSMTEEHRAELNYQIGLAWLQLPLAEYPESRDRAIDHLERAVDVFARQENPAYFGVTQHLLGTAWLELATGDVEANLHAAISCYEAALTIIRREIDYEAWGLTQASLGNAWGRLSTGNRDACEREAVACLERALEVITPASHPENWADILHDLAYSLTQLGASGGPDSEQFLRRAIECLGRLMQARGRHDSPIDWASAQCTLGAAWRLLPTGDPRENGLASIACFERAQQVYTREARPYLWAMTHLSVAEVWEAFPEGAIDGSSRAIEHCSLAGEVLTAAAFPTEHTWLLELLDSGRALTSGSRAAATSLASERNVRVDALEGGTPAPASGRE